MTAIKSAFTGTTGFTLAPSGDTSGTKDNAAVLAALGNSSHVILAPGSWYLSGLTLSLNAKWLQGSGLATQVNVPASATGITFSGVTQMKLSDMAFILGSGSLGVQVNGASDSHFEDLFFSGSLAAGAVAVNGDSGTEQHWTDIMIRGCGGIGFDYERTTATDTGGMYLDRVRIVSPPSTATGGFKFSSSAGSPTPTVVFMDQCVADSYYKDAFFMNNCASNRVTSSWFTLNAAATAGKVPLHVTGGFDQIYEGNYTYQPLAGFGVLIDGTAHEIQVGGGHVFDGGGSATALGLAAAGGNFLLGAYHSYLSTLTDTPAALSVNVGAQAPPTFQTSGSGGATNTLGIDDTANPGTEMWIRNSAGTIQFLNTAFSAAEFQMLQNGGLVCGQLLSNLAGGGTVSQGSGAPSKPNSVNPVAGDIYLRTDTPSTGNQRIYICTTGGGTPVWSGIV